MRSVCVRYAFAWIDAFGVSYAWLMRDDSILHGLLYRLLYRQLYRTPKKVPQYQSVAGDFSCTAKV